MQLCDESVETMKVSCGGTGTEKELRDDSTDRFE